MQILFVPMTEPDIELMLPLYNHYVRETTTTFHEAEVDVETMRPLLLPDDPRFGSWKVVVDGRPCGFVSLQPHDPRPVFSGTAEVTVYLDPAWPRKGLGTQALAFVEYRARERGFTSLLAVTCSENDASVRTFAKQGYSECARYPGIARKFGRRLDVLGLMKEL